MLCKLFDWQDPKDVCFTGNVTQSLNLILKGFLKPAFSSSAAMAAPTPGALGKDVLPLSK